MYVLYLLVSGVFVETTHSLQSIAPTPPCLSLKMNENQHIPSSQILSKDADPLLKMPMRGPAPFTNIINTSVSQPADVTSPTIGTFPNQISILNLFNSTEDPSFPAHFQESSLYDENTLNSFLDYLNHGDSFCNSSPVADRHYSVDICYDLFIFPYLILSWHLGRPCLDQTVTTIQHAAWFPDGFHSSNDRLTY